jgi:hypothetical protein
MGGSAKELADATGGSAKQLAEAMGGSAKELVEAMGGSVKQVIWHVVLGASTLIVVTVAGVILLKRN